MKINAHNLANSINQFICSNLGKITYNRTKRAGQQWQGYHW